MNPLRAATRFWHMRASWLGDGGQPVPQLQANARAAICAQCPLNNPDRPFWKFITEIGSAELRRQVELKAQMQLIVPHEDQLHVCDGCDCGLPLKVWSPIEHILATTPMDDLATECWIRQEAP